MVQNHKSSTLIQHGPTPYADATLNAVAGLGVVPTGGGINFVLVYSDGTQWLML